MTARSCFSARSATAAFAFVFVFAASGRIAAAQCTFEPSMASFTPGEWRCSDGAGFLWDLQSNSGEIEGGTREVYESWGQLCVTQNLALTRACSSVGETWSLSPTSRGTSTPVAGGAEIALGARFLSGLRVTRRIFVPHGGTEGYARFLEILENLTASPITAKVRFGSNGSAGHIRCDAVCLIAETDRGSSLLGPGLLWFVVEDRITTSGRPVVAMVMDNAGRDATARVSSSGLIFDEYQWEYEDITVPPGGRVAYLHFQVQRDTPAEAAAVARALTSPTAAHLAGIDLTLHRDIVNFELAPPPNCGDGVLQPE